MRVHRRAEHVGQQELLAQADDEAAETLRHLADVRRSAAELRGDVVVLHDGAGDQLGEEGNVEQQLKKVRRAGIRIAVDVDRVGHALEGEEGDADGQGEGGQAQTEAGQVADHAAEEAEVLEQGQHGHVQAQRHGQNCLPYAEALPEQKTREVVQQGHADQKRQVRQGACAVEQQAREQEQDVSRQTAADHKVEQKNRGQKGEYKCSRAKSHLSISSDETVIVSKAGAEAPALPFRRQTGRRSPPGQREKRVFSRFIVSAKPVFVNSHGGLFFCGIVVFWRPAARRRCFGRRI